MSYRCRYPGCERTFDTKLGRSVHERLIHGTVLTSRETPYKCPYCDKPTYFDSDLTLQVHLEEYHGVKSQFLDWLNKRSFENLVYTYNDELHKIQHDNVVGGVLKEREVTKLLREGVLIIDEYGRMGKKTVYKLSDEALKVLGSKPDSL